MNYLMTTIRKETSNMKQVKLSTKEYLQLFHGASSVQLTQVRSFAENHKDVTSKMNVESITDKLYNSSAHIYWEFRNLIPKGRYGLLVEQKLKNGETGSIFALDTQMMEKIFTKILNR